MMNLIFTHPLMAQDKLVWEKISSGISEPSVIKIISTKGRIYALTDKALYQKSDHENAFRLLISLPLNNQEINDAVIQNDGIFIATRRGAFEINLNDQHIREIFRSSNAESNNCLSIQIMEDQIFLGTQKGLFVQEIGKNNWKLLDGELKRSSVRQLDQDINYIWAATDHEVFTIYPDDLSIKKVFSEGFNSESGSVDETNESVENKRPLIKALSIDKYLGYAFAATSQGIFRSNDQGDTWSFLSSERLPNEEITTLLITQPDFESSEHALYQMLAGTIKGIFKNIDGNWKSVYQGMETLLINELSVHNKEVLAATDQGIFILQKVKPHRLANTQRVEMVKPAEPSIQKVHQMAIKYAEVDPKKISQWRELAQKRAWYPDLSIGVDGGQDKTIADSVYGSSSSGGQQYVGPDDKSYGRDFGWDISLSWDLADVVWSDAQTSIDSRAKLMVELRDDLLNQVTRLYFERRRAQMELTSEELDEDLFMEKEMRIEELTALIDALTGGEFSRDIKKENNLM